MDSGTPVYSTPKMCDHNLHLNTMSTRDGSRKASVADHVAYADSSNSLLDSPSRW
jgi:hypothetical protein